MGKGRCLGRCRYQEIVQGAGTVDVAFSFWPRKGWLTAQDPTSLGRHAEVLEPEELANEILDEAIKMSQPYSTK